MGVEVGTGVGVRVTVGVGTGVEVGTGVGVRVTVGVGTGVEVGTGVGVRVTVGVGMGVEVGTGVGVRVTVGVGTGVVGVGVGVLIPNAFAAFNLPPVATFPEREGRLSQDPRILLFICAPVREGDWDFKRAATPVTYGAAIDVPFR